MFKPEPYWALDLGLVKGGSVNRAVWKYGRSFNRGKAEEIARESRRRVTSVRADGEAVMVDNTVVVAAVTKRRVKQGRPVPLNTVNFLKVRWVCERRGRKTGCGARSRSDERLRWAQGSKATERALQLLRPPRLVANTRSSLTPRRSSQACSKGLGIGPHSALQTAERLYLSGYLSYPRTESTAYPKSFDVRYYLEQQASNRNWGAYVRGLLAAGFLPGRGGYDAGDHPPITPMRGTEGELTGDLWRVYELVVRHFIGETGGGSARSEATKRREYSVDFTRRLLGSSLRSSSLRSSLTPLVAATVSEDAVWDKTHIELQVNGVEGDKGCYTLDGKELVDPGFLKVLLHRQYGDERDKELDDAEERAMPNFRQGETIPILPDQEEGSGGGGTVQTARTGTRATVNVREKMTVAPGYLTESDLIGLMEKHGIGTDASIPTHIENILKRKYANLETGRRLKPSKVRGEERGTKRSDEAQQIPQRH